MKKRLISTLTCAALTFTIIGTSLPAFAVEDVNNQQNKEITQDEDNHTYGNTELTEENYKWMNENMEDETARIFNKAYGKKTSWNKVRAAALNDSSESSLPKSKDLSQTPYFPEIGNQGAIGSCAAFAAVYYQMSYATNKSLGITDERSRITFSPKWIYNITNRGHNAGSNSISNYEAIQKFGALTLDDYPYDSDYTAWSTKASDWVKAQKYTIHNDENKKCYSQIDIFKNPVSNTVSDTTAYIDSIKTVLNEENILNIDTFAKSLSYNTIKDLNSASNKDDYSDKVSSNYEGEKIVQYSKDTYEGGHAVTIVGYDDTIWTDINNDNEIQPSELGAFKLANSWGTNSSSTNKGFFWVSYDAFNKVSQVPIKENASPDESAYSLKRIPFSSGLLTWIDSSNIVVKDVPLYAEFTLNTDMRRECEVTLTAKNINSGEETIYSDFNPFDINSLGYLSFDGSKEKNDGSFAIDLSKVIPNIDSDSLKSYTWTLNVKDTQDDESYIIVKDFKIVDENTHQKYNKSFEKEISVDKSSVDLTINPNEPEVKISSVCINDSNTVPVNKYVNLSCLTTDGNDNIYKFKVINNDSKDIEEINAGHNSSINWAPKETGSYSIYVSVTDSYGNTDATYNTPTNLTVIEKNTDSSILSPENLPYTKTSNSITLNWNIEDNSNISKYYIYRNGHFIGTSDTTSYTDNNYNDSYSYKYTVRAVRNDGLYGSSDVDLSNTSYLTLFKISGDGINTVSCGDTIKYTIGAANAIGDVNYNCEVYDYNSNNLVANLSSKSGTFTWQPESTGTYYLSFTATDSNNNASNNIYSLISVVDPFAVEISGNPDTSFTLNDYSFKENFDDEYNKNLILSWNKPKENVQINKYKVYCNDEYLGETTSRIFRTVNHKADENTYNYKVVALDKDENVLATSSFYTIEQAPHGIYVTIDTPIQTKGNNIMIKVNDIIDFSMIPYGKATNVTYSYELEPFNTSALIVWNNSSPHAALCSKTPGLAILIVKAKYTADGEDFEFYKQYVLNFVE